jgi:NAD(P)H-dependent FMN reductase
MQAMQHLLPVDVNASVYEGMADLPHFDDGQYEHHAVRTMIAALEAADGLLIVTPEYAFGVPGSLKNLLDWTVASGVLNQKPVALVTASSQGEKGHAALIHILTALGTIQHQDRQLLISFVRTKLDESGNIKDPALKMQLQQVILSLCETARQVKESIQQQD